MIWWKELGHPPPDGMALDKKSELSESQYLHP